MFGGPFHFSWFLRPSFDEKLAASPMTEILMTTGMTNNKLKNIFIRIMTMFFLFV